MTTARHIVLVHASASAPQQLERDAARPGPAAAHFVAHWGGAGTGQVHDLILGLLDEQPVPPCHAIA